MKYLITSIVSLTFLVTYMANSNEIEKIIDANSAGYFSVTKNQGAFLSFDISSAISNISKSENIVLSLFLESKKGAGDTSKFILYPVDRISKKVGTIGIIVEVETHEGSFVDFVIPPKLLEGITNPLGFIIQTNQESTFVFNGPDMAGTTSDPKLVVVEGRENIFESSFEIPGESKTKLEQQLDRIENLVKKEWWENAWIQAVMLIGAIAGIMALYFTLRWK